MNGAIRVAERFSLVFLVWLAGCSQADPGAARPSDERLVEQVRGAFSEGGHLARASKLVPLLQRLAPENLDAVREVYDEYMPALSECELQLFVDAWTGFDGPAALEYAMAIPFAQQRGVASEAAVQGWAIRDPQSANQAVTELLTRRPRKTKDLPSSLVAGWALAPQGGLEDFLLSVPERPDLIGVAVGAVYRRAGPERTLRWAEELIRKDDNAERQWLTFRQAVRQVALRNPELAVPFVLAHFGKRDFARDGPAVLAEAWGRRDPIRAFEWLGAEAPAESRAVAVRMAFGNWLYRDRTGALKWLESRPVDPFYFPAFDVAARRAAKDDHDKAFGLCNRIAEEPLHQECLASVAEVWYRRDPVAAGAWLEESPLDVKTRDAIRERGKTRQARRPSAR